METPERIPSDGELLKAMQMGDEEATAKLVLRHNAAILTVLIAFLAKKGCNCPPDHAEEVKTKVWINILHYLNTLHDTAKFEAWRDQIARNEANNHLRSCIPGQNNFVALEDGASLPDGKIADNHQVIENAELVNKALGLAENLSPKLAEIIRLRFEEGLSWDEIAEQFGENRETLRTFYNRGLIKLRKKLGGRRGG
jgi:RNA polymerase sigma-70 factor (ECF subfamily)